MKNEEFTPGGKPAWVVLLVLLLLNVFNYMDRKVIAVAMEAIKADLGFTDTQMGMIQGLFLFSVGMLILPAGILIDRWSRRKAVALMAVIWSGATVATGLCHKFSTMGIARAVTGTGEAGFQPGGTSWISVIFHKKDRTKANGIFLMGPLIGGVAGLIAGGWLITRTGSWRIPFFCFGIPGILLGVAALFLKDVAPTAQQKAGNLKKEFSALFQRKCFIGASLTQGLYIVVCATYQSWNVVLLMRGYGLNEAEAGTALGLMILPAVLAPFVGGFLADFFQKRSPIGRPLFAAIGCLLGTTLWGIQYYVTGIAPYSYYLVLMGLAAFAGSMPIATFQVINMDVFPVDRRAKAAAMAGLISFLFFSWWGSMIVGKISDLLGGGAYGIKTALLVTIPFGILASLISCWTCRHYARESAETDALEKQAEMETTGMPDNPPAPNDN